MSLASSITALQKRCAAIEAKDRTQDSALTDLQSQVSALSARITALEQNATADYSAEIAALKADVEVLMAWYTIYNENQTPEEPEEPPVRMLPYAAAADAAASRPILTQYGLKRMVPLYGDAVAAAPRPTLTWRQQSSAEYGCGTKPTTTRTLTSVTIPSGTHDVTYSYVTFAGHVNYGTYGATMAFGSGSADTYNITFDHCVFKTSSGQTYDHYCDVVKLYNNPSTLTRFHDITFTNCWFETCNLFQIELNSRMQHWPYNITIDHCTFERTYAGALGSNGNLSMDHGSNDGTLPIVNGVPRFFENVRVTNNLFMGAGATMFEIRGFSHLAGSEATTRSHFSHNRVACAGSVQFSFSSSAGNTVEPGCIGMYFEENLFEETWSPQGVTKTAGGAFWRTPAAAPSQMSHCLWKDNTFIIAPNPNGSLRIGQGGVGDPRGHGNTYSGNTWTGSGTVQENYCYFPATTTTYTNEYFDLPGLLHFASDAHGYGCEFTPRCTHTGGTWT